MGKLTVKREKSFLSSARKYKIILDGETIGQVSNNDTVTLDVPEGEHTIQVGISLINGISKKLKVNFNQDESVVVVKPNPIMWAILICVIILGANLGIGLSRGIFSWPIFVVIMIFIGLSTIFAVSIKQEK